MISDYTANYQINGNRSLFFSSVGFGVRVVLVDSHGAVHIHGWIVGGGLHQRHPIRQVIGNVALVAITGTTILGFYLSSKSLQLIWKSGTLLISSCPISSELQRLNMMVMYWGNNPSNGHSVTFTIHGKCCNSQIVYMGYHMRCNRQNTGIYSICYKNLYLNYFMLYLDVIRILGVIHI